MSNPGFRFYREHKFVRYLLNEFECTVEQADFTCASDIQKVRAGLADVQALMEGHAQHEDKVIHQLLREKGSTAYEAIEAEHKHHDVVFQELKNILEQIESSSDSVRQIKLGYQFNLVYRNFVGENLIHFHQEETVIMSELERLYSTEELRQVEFNTYHKMTPEQMIDMMRVLFPHFNRYDRESFLRDIQDAEPDKFSFAWAGIKPSLDAAEQYYFEKILKIDALNQIAKQRTDLTRMLV